MPELSHRRFFSLRPVFILAAVLGIAATILLGNWQVRRGAQKEAVQASIVAAMKAPPLLLKEPFPSPQALVYQPVTLVGHWMIGKEVYLDNRPNEGRAGFYVVMPIELVGGGVVLVNRGWLPRAAGGRTLIAPFQTPSSTITVTGIAIKEEPGFLELGHHVAGATGQIWQNFSYEEYERAAGVAPLRVIVREDRGPEDGLLRNWPDRDQSIETQIDRHHGYAFQWYAMAFAIFCLAIFYGVRNARSNR